MQRAIPCKYNGCCTRKLVMYEPCKKWNCMSFKDKVNLQLTHLLHVPPHLVKMFTWMQTCWRFAAEHHWMSQLVSQIGSWARQHRAAWLRHSSHLVILPSKCMTHTSLNPCFSFCALVSRPMDLSPAFFCLVAQERWCEHQHQFKSSWFMTMFDLTSCFLFHALLSRPIDSSQSKICFFVLLLRSTAANINVNSQGDDGLWPDLTSLLDPFLSPILSFVMSSWLAFDQRETSQVKTKNQLQCPRVIVHCANATHLRLFVGTQLRNWLIERDVGHTHTTIFYSPFRFMPTQQTELRWLTGLESLLERRKVVEHGEDADRESANTFHNLWIISSFVLSLQYLVSHCYKGLAFKALLNSGTVVEPASFAEWLLLAS